MALNPRSTLQLKLPKLIVSTCLHYKSSPPNIYIKQPLLFIMLLHQKTSPCSNGVPPLSVYPVPPFDRQSRIRNHYSIMLKPYFPIWTISSRRDAPLVHWPEIALAEAALHVHNIRQSTARLSLTFLLPTFHHCRPDAFTNIQYSLTMDTSYPKVK